MRTWIIIDGEKTGPFEIVQVVRRIEAGELKPSHYGWVEGMKEWQALAEIPQFKDSFTVSVTPVETPAMPVESSPLAVAEIPAMLVRRLFARWFDTLVWSMFFMCMLVVAKADFMGLMVNLWFNYAMMLVWIMLESMMIHLWGCTPGKALLGIRVRRLDGSPIPLGRSLLRALRVYLMGMGMSHPILMPICHGFSWWFVRKHGATLWDGPAGFAVTITPISAWRWVAYTICIITLMNIAGTILEPVTREMMQQMFPEGASWLPKAPSTPKTP